MLKLLSLLVICIGSATAVTYFEDSAVVVAKDVPPGTSINIPIAYTYLYRVYATYTTQAQTGFASYIQITDSDGDSTYLSILANSVGNGYGELDYFNARGPTVTITNHNNVGSTQYAFTIYLVSTHWSEAPVISAAKSSGKIQSNNPLWTIGDAVTVISAEPSFNLYNFDLGSLSALTIGANGYDEDANLYKVMKIDDRSRASASFITVASPICTLFKNTETFSDHFSFSIDTTIAPVRSVSPKGFVSIMSPGWMSYGKSFTIDWEQTNVNTTIDFGSDNYLDMNLQVGEIYSGESVRVQVQVNGGAPTYDTTYNSTIKEKPQSYGRYLTVSSSSNNYDHDPRFLLQLK